MSYTSLKERLNRISTKSDTTFDLSDTKKWLKGNRPEDWEELVDYVSHSVTFAGHREKQEALSDLYYKAFKEMNGLENKNNETYAYLFVRFARLRSEMVPDDATLIFNQARAYSRKFAIAHIASAQFEVDKGNHDKAIKLLEKALLFEAKPKEDIKVALEKLKKGETNIYVSPVLRRRNESGQRKFSSGSESSEELKSVSQFPDNLSGNLSANLAFSIPSISKNPPASVAPEPMSDIKIPLQTNRLSLIAGHSAIDSSVHKQGMHKFRSTPLLNSEKRSSAIIGLPARVKKAIIPTEEHEEDSLNNTMDSFKPLETKSTIGFNSHAHTSGYLSMMSEPTIPMETKQTEEHVKISKMSPLMELEPPVKQAKEALPVPDIAPAGDLVQQTPNNKVPIPSTPMANMDVITVNDKQYAKLSVIGRGGSSKVYQVFDNQISDSKSESKIKAIKEVNLDNANDTIVEGYKNEINLLKRLQYCDKVIKMYDSEFKESENKLYVVMESGSEDLATFFRSQTQNRKRLSDSVVWFYWERMLLAVQALHKEGIIHSDLKPANFLLVGGNLKLIDFGIAKALQQDKTSVILETPIGTLNYMSPEAIMDSCGNTQGQGKPKYKIGVKSDVWSLGCILYNMVYSRTPFQHLSDFIKLQAIINPDFPIEFPDIRNKHLLDVLKRCLNRDPKQRPSIDELLNHPYLKSKEEGQAVSEMSTPPTEEKLNRKMEALVSTLASQFACSPGQLRNLIHKTIDTEDGKSENDSLNFPGKSSQPPPKQALPICSSYRSQPQVKHLRTALTTLKVSNNVGGDAGLAHSQHKPPDAT